MKKLLSLFFALAIATFAPLAVGSGVSSPNTYNPAQVAITGGTINGVTLTASGLITANGGITAVGGISVPYTTASTQPPQYQQTLGSVNNIGSNLIGVRGLNITYTNTLLRPIVIKIVYTILTGNAANFAINGTIVEVHGNNTTTTNEESLSNIVPVGATYSLVCSVGCSEVSWYEY